MPEHNDKGSLASNQGKVLENTVESTFKSKGCDSIESQEHIQSILTA
jgi:hypothetical protein